MDKEELKTKVFQNFNRNARWLGIIDYKSLIVLLIYMYVIYFITGILNIKILVRLYVLVIFSIPMIILTVMYSNEESVIDMLITIAKYILSNIPIDLVYNNGTYSMTIMYLRQIYYKYVHIPNKKDALDLVISKDNFR